jgi:hypothetical protein
MTCVTKKWYIDPLSLEFLPSEASHFQATGFVLTGIVDDVHKVVKGQYVRNACQGIVPENG